MILLAVILAVLVAWVLLSALTITSYRGFLFVWDEYGLGPALCLLAAQAAVLTLLGYAW